MDNYLIVRNFGPVEEARIELKPYVVLIGGQGTGKSTLAKLLSIFQEKLWYLSILHSDQEEAWLESFKKYGIHRYFLPNTYLEYRKDDLHLVFDKKFALSYQGKTAPEELQPLLFSLLTDNLVKFADVVKSDIQELTQAQQASEGKKEAELKEYFKDYLNQQYRASIIQSTFFNTGDQLYIPAERNLAASFLGNLASVMVSGIPLQDKLLNFISYFEKARAGHATYDIPFLHLTYVYDGKGEEGIRIPGVDRILPLAECSSGIQALLPMLMVLDYCIDNGIFKGYVIEEPEQNLFPDNLLAALRYIISKNNRHHTSCIITTHSPYLLSGINLSLMAGQVAQCDTLQNQVDRILPSEYHLVPGSVAAYSLGGTDVYCKDIIHPQTGTIDQNYLDTASAIVGQEFGKLYKLYLQTLK